MKRRLRAVPDLPSAYSPDFRRFSGLYPGSGYLQVISRRWDNWYNGCQARLPCRETLPRRAASLQYGNMPGMMRVGNILLVGGIVVSLTVLSGSPATAQEERARQENPPQDEESTIRVDVDVESRRWSARACHQRADPDHLRSASRFAQEITCQSASPLLSYDRKVDDRKAKSAIRSAAWETYRLYD